MNELIKKLKDKDYVRAFGLMTAEEQKCYKKTTKGNCEIYIYPDWVPQTPPNHTSFNFGDTYAIVPDYQPEPEYVDLEIVQNSDRPDKWLGVHGALLASYDFCDLHCLPSLPNFKCFWYENKCRLSYEDVSAIISEKKKVYARFRK